MPNPLTSRYQPILLPVDASAADLAAVREPYEAIIVTQFRAILDRTERGPLYPWLDTRLDLNTGAELPAADPRFGPGLISGWVQGRGLESLATFGAWLARWPHEADAAALLQRVRRVTATLLAQFRAVRSRHGGHFHFTMLPDGLPIAVDAQGRQLRAALAADAPHTYSDLFAAKGMYAAAQFLGHAAALDEARAFCRAVVADILSLRFHTDQPQPAGLASVVSAAGGFPHGPAMIALGLAALLAQHEPGPESTELGLRLARRVLYGHVNLDARWPGLLPHDLVEFITAAGEPHADAAGRIISDPGHSLEFVGLFLKFAAAAPAAGDAAAATPEQRGELTHMARLMPAILARAFANGFRPALGGIIKSLDLRTRAAVDDTMPWWSLPETIRAATLAARRADDAATAAACRSTAAQCHNAFVQHYLRPDIHLMAIKLRDAEGHVSPLIPAYPDADPGYHTALSLLDALA